MNLSTKLADIKGVGPKTAAGLLAAGFETTSDLINFLPRVYDDFSKVEKIADLKPGKVTIKARAESVNTRFVRRGMRVTTAVLADDSGKAQAVWFNQPYRATQLKSGEFYLSGEFKLSSNRYQLSNPSVEAVKDLPVQTGRILPVYPKRKGLKPSVTRKILNELKPLVTMLHETLPAEIVAREKLISRSEALLNLHFPQSKEDAEIARERLSFEELFNLILAARLNKNENSRLNGFKIPFDLDEFKKILASLPFALTGAQKKAIWEIIQDFNNNVIASKAKQSNATCHPELVSGSNNKEIAESDTSPDWIPEQVRNDAAMDLSAKSANDESRHHDNRVFPMNRLLQGDVGSGKTIVAGLAAFVAARAGYQTAVMAPTEILATQHAKTLAELLTPFGINVALLTGSVKGKSREVLLKQIENGAAQIVVGTHALFQPAVKFHKLGFAVIDEQHRFGVKQRQELLAKGDNVIASNAKQFMDRHGNKLPRDDEAACHPELVSGSNNKEVIEDDTLSDWIPGQARNDNTGAMPHLLSMTATPIPRSLQLTVFGDLDISILNELPKGRQPIKTQIVSPVSRASMSEKIAAELQNGRQVYFIAPLIENSERSEKENVSNLYKKVVKEFCHPEFISGSNKKDANNSNWIPEQVRNDIKVGVLHGQQPAETKDKIMRDFAEDRIQILVATTVVEVGVDVPNASVIVIENADQFGLSQLHQLRGRVGRGAHQSFCYLVMSDSSAPTQRLREIERSNDGFYLAEVDLELRGAGEIYGTAQHGQLNLQIANLADTKLIKRASKAATDFANEISQNPEILLKYGELAREVNKYQRLTTLN